MSSITWQEHRLFQKVKNHREELGYIEYDENSKNYVLWLNDTCGLLGLNGGHIRGDEFPSMEAAKQKAASSPSAYIFHHLWMKVVKQKDIRAADDHWEEISPHLPHDASKDDSLNRFSRLLEQLPIEKIEAIAEKIIKVGRVIMKLIKFFLSLFFGG